MLDFANFLLLLLNSYSALRGGAHRRGQCPGELRKERPVQWRDVGDLHLVEEHHNGNLTEKGVRVVDRLWVREADRTALDCDHIVGHRSALPHQSEASLSDILNGLKCAPEVLIVLLVQAPPIRVSHHANDVLEELSLGESSGEKPL